MAEAILEQDVPTSTDNFDQYWLRDENWDKAITKKDLLILKLKLENQIKETELVLSKEITTRIKQSEDRTSAKIKESENRLNAKITESENRLNAKIKESENRLNAKIKESENRLNAKITESENRLNAKIKESENRLNAKIIESENRLKIQIREEVNKSKNQIIMWLMPILFTIMLGILGLLIKVFGLF